MIVPLHFRTLASLPFAHSANWLIIGDILRKSTNSRHTHTHVLEQLQKLIQIVVPSKPTTMSSINVKCYMGCLQLLNGICNSSFVCIFCCCVATLGVVQICG